MNISGVTGSGQPYPLEVNSSGTVGEVNPGSAPEVRAQVITTPLGQLDQALKKSGVSVGLPSAEAVSKEQQLDALTNLERIDPSSVAVDMVEFMTILHQCGVLMRQTERTNRALKLSAQVGALLNAADAMQSAADKRLAAGITQGVMGILGGCVQVGGGALQIGQAGKALESSNAAIKASSDSQDFGEQAAAAQTANNPQLAKNFQDNATAKSIEASTRKAEADNFSSKAQAVGQIGAGVGAIVNSTSTIISSALTQGADLDEVKRTRFEAEAKAHEAAFQNSNEMMQTAQEIVQDMKEKVAAVVQAENDSLRGITRNI